MYGLQPKTLSSLRLGFFPVHISNGVALCAIALWGRLLIKYTAAAIASDQKDRSRLAWRRMLSAQLMIARFSLSIIPFCSDWYGTIVRWVMPSSLKNS